MSRRPRAAQPLSFCGVRLHRIGPPSDPKRRGPREEGVPAAVLYKAMKLTLQREFSAEFNAFLEWMNNALSKLLAGLKLNPKVVKKNAWLEEKETRYSPALTPEAEDVLATADSRRNLRVWLQRAMPPSQTFWTFDPNVAIVPHGLHLWFLHSAEVDIPREFQDRAVLDVLLKADFGALRLYGVSKALRDLTTLEEEFPTMRLLRKLLFTERERNHRPRERLSDKGAWVRRANKLGLARLHILRTRLAAALQYREMRSAVGAGLQSHTGGNPRLLTRDRMSSAPRTDNEEPASASLDFAVACCRRDKDGMLLKELTCSACVTFHGVDLGKDIVAQIAAQVSSRKVTLPPLTGTSGLIRYARNYDTAREPVDSSSPDEGPYDTQCKIAAKSWAHLATLFVEPLQEQEQEQEPAKFAWRLLGESYEVNRANVTDPCAVARFDGPDSKQEFLRLIFDGGSDSHKALVFADFDSVTLQTREPDNWRFDSKEQLVLLDPGQTPGDPLMCDIGDPQIFRAETRFPSAMFNPAYGRLKHQYFRGMPLSVARPLAVTGKTGNEFELSSATVVGQAYFAPLGLDLDSVEQAVKPVSQIATPQLVMDCVDRPLSIAENMLADNDGWHNVRNAFLTLTQTDDEPSNIVKFGTSSTFMRSI